MFGILMLVISCFQCLRIYNRKRYYESISKGRCDELRIENLLKSKSTEFVKKSEEYLKKLTVEERNALCLWAEDWNIK